MLRLRKHNREDTGIWRELARITACHVVETMRKNGSSMKAQSRRHANSARIGANHRMSRCRDHAEEWFVSESTIAKTREFGANWRESPHVTFSRPLVEWLQDVSKRKREAKSEERQARSEKRQARSEKREARSACQLLLAPRLLLPSTD